MANPSKQHSMKEDPAVNSWADCQEPGWIELVATQDANGWYGKGGRVLTGQARTMKREASLKAAFSTYVTRRDAEQHTHTAPAAPTLNDNHSDPRVAQFDGSPSPKEKLSTEGSAQSSADIPTDTITPNANRQLNVTAADPKETRPALAVEDKDGKGEVGGLARQQSIGKSISTSIPQSDATTASSKRDRSAMEDNDEDSDSEEDRRAKRQQGGKTVPKSKPTETTVKPKRRAGLKKGEGVGTPRKPGKRSMTFDTNYYKPFRWNEDADRRPVGAPIFKGSFSIYDGFKLVTGPAPEDFRGVEHTPFNNTRLDDRWIGLVTGQFKNSELAYRWPGEFDTSGMVRAQRIPLGDPCLIWVEKGIPDCDQNPARKSACYYGWYRGLQLLCGKEGLDLGLFLVRPGFEVFKCKTLTFKREYDTSHPKRDADLEAVMLKGKVVIRPIGNTDSEGESSSEEETDDDGKEKGDGDGEEETDVDSGSETDEDGLNAD